jgi:hypothetical protein
MLAACCRRESRQLAPARPGAGLRHALNRTRRTVLGETRRLELEQLAGDPRVAPTRVESGTRACIVSPRTTNARAELTAFALPLPEASEDFPWGERAAKDNGKVFLFLGHDQAAGPVGMSVKLVESHGHALAVEGVKPTGYGLGRAGLGQRSAPR